MIGFRKKIAPLIFSTGFSLFKTHCSSRYLYDDDDQEEEDGLQHNVKEGPILAESIDYRGGPSVAQEALTNDWAIDMDVFTDATGLSEQITVDFDDNFY